MRLSLRLIVVTVGALAGFVQRRTAFAAEFGYGCALRDLGLRVLRLFCLRPKLLAQVAPFLNIMNEWYLRDLSRKQRTAIRVKGESGKPTSNQAIYGYKKDPDNKYHWLIDEEAAAVVRRIFQLTIEGHGPYEIARILYDDKVEAPAVYLARQNRGVWKSKEEFRSLYNWTGHVVGQILAKPEYMGDTVNFRSHKASYKDKRAVMNPQDEWLIFENTHEAIVDRETWELAQKLRKTPRRIDHIEEANPFTGLLYCAECGAKMYNHRCRAGSNKRSAPTDFFDCSTYTLYKQRRETGCCSHYMTTSTLRKLVLDAIRHVSTYAIANQEEFLSKVHAASQIRQEEAAKLAKRRLNKDRKRIAELDNIIKKLYESYAIGRITDERFDSLMAEYESEQKIDPGRDQARGTASPSPRKEPGALSEDQGWRTCRWTAVPDHLQMLR